MGEESFRYIRKPWIGGNGTMYFGIPPKIIKKLKLDQSRYLLIDVIGEILVIKKITQQFSKTEIKKIQTSNLAVEERKVSIGLVEDGKDKQDGSYNPLDEVF